MRTDIRLALPSKGRLQESTLEFLAHCGFQFKQNSSRGYVGSIAMLPGVTVLLQRPSDIITSVSNGGVDLGITGYDVIADANVDDSVRVLHDALGFGRCKVVIAVPDALPVTSVAELATYAKTLAQPLRVATKYKHLTRQFFEQHGITPFALINAEGSLEVVPEIGYADIIVDIAETGSTLQANRLRMINGGVMLSTQASLVANRQALARPEVLAVATEMLEYIEAHQRAEGVLMIWANVRGRSYEDVGRTVTTQTNLGGLQGPTIAPIFPNPHSDAQAVDTHWFSVSIAVTRSQLTDAIEQLRGIGASGVVVTPITYIFEEQPARVAALKASTGSTQ
jgi:ATP phosphoribosyltransferase